MLADRCVHQRVQAQPLPLQVLRDREAETRQRVPERYVPGIAHVAGVTPQDDRHPRSEEHTSELQSRSDLVCRLLLEKKKKQQPGIPAAAAKAQTRKREGPTHGATVAKGRPKGAWESPPPRTVAFEQTMLPALTPASAEDL